MKHTELYNEYKKLDELERQELIAAVKAHGGEYVFIHVDEDGNYDDDEQNEAPIVAASTRYMDSYEDFYISRVEVKNDYLSIYGWPKESWSGEDEIDSVAHGHLGYITDMIDETETVKDVSIDAHKHKVYAAFGTDLVMAVAERKVDTIEAEMAYPDGFKVREFNTQAEADAYIKGLDDACGWMESAVLNPKNPFESKIIDKIKNR